MFLRLLILVFLFSACRTGEIACPKVKLVKLNKRPSNYLLRSSSRSLTARAQEEKEKLKPEIKFPVRNAKSIDSIEEWDCPKPGSRNAMPKSVRENIKKNRKKFETYYRSRAYPAQPDSVQSRLPR